MSALLTGIVYGLVLMLSTGPSFFYLIKVGIEKGFRRALSFAFGIFVSDIILLTLIFIGLKPLFQDTIFQQVFSLSSGVLILAFGISIFIRKRASYNVITVKDRPLYMYAVRGLGINLLNPFTVVMWVGVLGTVSPPDQRSFLHFVTGVLGVIFFADAIKAYLAKVIGKAMTPRAIYILNKILGIAFLFIGLYFVFLFYQSYSSGNEIDVTIPDL